MKFIGFLLFAAIITGLFVWVAKGAGIREAIEIYATAAALSGLLWLAICMMSH